MPGSQFLYPNDLAGFLLNARVLVLRLAYLAQAKTFARSVVLSSWKRLGLGYGLNHRG